MTALKIDGRSIACFCLILIAAACLSAQKAVNPFPENEIAISKLSNGMRVVVREDHSLPVVSMVVVVKGGSGAEANTRGIAHYLEHLTFQGTKKYPTALGAQFALESVGGLCNAVTTRDMIRYEASAPSSRAAEVIDTLAEVTLAPLLTEERFYAERAIILEEMQLSDDNPVVSLAERGYALAYRTHPYRHDPSGSIEDVLRLSIDDVRDFYKRWFVPNNMSLIIVGDVTGKQAVELAKKAFGQAVMMKTPLWPNGELKPEGAMTIAHFTRDLADTYQTLLFPAPPASDHASLVATDLAVELLSEGELALLPNWWTHSGIAVKQFGIEFVSARSPGRMLIWAQSAPSQAEKVKDATQTLLAQLTAEKIAPLLADAKRRICARMLLDNEGYSQQASTLAIYEGIGQPALASRYVSLVESMTAERVAAAMPKTPVAWVTLGADWEER